MPTIKQDLSRKCIATSGESVSAYPRRPKAEAFSNVVYVVKRLHDPTDPSIERMAPLCSAHVQHGDVPRALDPVEDEGEFLQHDGMATMMMKLRHKASPRHYDNKIEVENYGGGHHTQLKINLCYYGVPPPLYIKGGGGGGGPATRGTPNGGILLLVGLLSLARPTGASWPPPLLLYIRWQGAP